MRAVLAFLAAFLLSLVAFVSRAGPVLAAGWAWPSSGPRHGRVVCDAGAGCAVGGALVFLGARVLVLSSVAASVLFLPLVPSGLGVPCVLGPSLGVGVCGVHDFGVGGVGLVVDGARVPVVCLGVGQSVLESGVDLLGGARGAGDGRWWAGSGARPVCIGTVCAAGLVVAGAALV